MNKYKIGLWLTNDREIKNKKKENDHHKKLVCDDLKKTETGRENPIKKK